MSDKFKKQMFKASDLELVKQAPAPDSQQLVIGDWCVMNSGSPALLVVDAEMGEDKITIALASGDEVTMPRACVRKCKAPDVSTGGR